MSVTPATLTMNQTAEALGLCRLSVFRLIKTGVLPATKPDGRHVAIPAPAVHRLRRERGLDGPEGMIGRREVARLISRHPQTNAIWIPQFKHFLMTGEISPAPDCIETCLDQAKSQITRADGPSHMRLLTDLQSGHAGIVNRLKGSAEENAALSEFGLRQGAQVEMEEIGDLGQSYRVKLGDKSLTLNRDEAKLVQVIVD